MKNSAKNSSNSFRKADKHLNGPDYLNGKNNFNLFKLNEDSDYEDS